jgi:hypothetical protein
LDSPAADPETGGGDDRALGGDGDADAADEGTGEPAEPKHRQLLKAGKVNAALREAFGEHASLDWLKVDDTKFAALRRKEGEFAGKVNEARADLANRLQEAKNAEANLRRDWGPTKLIEDAAQKGDVVATIEQVAKRMQVAPDELVRAYVKGLKELPREARDRLARLEEQQPARAPQPVQQQQPAGPTPQQQQAAVQRAVAELGDHLSGHAVAKLSNYGQRVFAEIKAQYAKDRTKLTPEQAADRVIAKRKREVESDLWLVEGGERPATPRPAATPPKRRLRGAQTPETNLSGQQLRDAALAKFFPGRSKSS